MTDAATSSSSVERHIGPEHPAFNGHFPGRPLLPGAALLAEVLESALDEPALAARLGSQPLLDSIKFLAPVTPGSDLRIEWRLKASSAAFSVTCGASLVARGQFVSKAA